MKWTTTALATALLCLTSLADQTAVYNADDCTIIVRPSGWRSKHSLGEFSCSYLRWGTIKSEGKQIQYGKLTPALAVVDCQLHVVYTANKKLYRRAEFWLAAGPALVVNGKPNGKWRKDFPTLNSTRRTHRIAVCVRGNRFWFVYRFGSLNQLQRDCLRSGAEHALNLDGGSCAVFSPNRVYGAATQYQVVVVPRRTRRR